MRISKPLLSMAAAMSAVSAANAATTVNVDGLSNASLDGSAAVSVALAAGTYKLSFIKDAYTAFTRFSGPSGCDANGKNCFTGYENSVKYVVNGNTFSLGDRGANGGLGAFPGSSTYYQDAATSFANSGGFSSLITLASPASVDFYLFDDNLSDNGGGVSLSLAGVPEPASWALMIAGFGLVGSLARRRQHRASLTFA